MKIAPPAAGALSGARAVAALFAAAIAALSIHGIVFLAALPSRLPSASDWQRVAARLEREAQPADAVALAPWWAERARAVLPAALPVLAFPRLAGEDLPGIRRVWVVAVPSAPGGTGLVERDLAGRGTRAVAAERVGALALSRFDLAEPVLPLSQLSERIDGASASLMGRPCPRDRGGALRCPGRAGAHVSREAREVDLLPRVCLVIEPPPAAGPLTLTFPAVPLGRTLRVLTGIVGETPQQADAAVKVGIALDGRDAGETEERPGTPGWHRTDVDSAALAGRPATLTFTVRAGRGHPRPICLEAYALP